MKHLLLFLVLLLPFSQDIFAISYFDRHKHIDPRKLMSTYHKILMSQETFQFFEKEFDEDFMKALVEKAQAQRTSPRIFRSSFIIIVDEEELISSDELIEKLRIYLRSAGPYGEKYASYNEDVTKILISSQYLTYEVLNLMGRIFPNLQRVMLLYKTPLSLRKIEPLQNFLHLTHLYLEAPHYVGSTYDLFNFLSSKSLVWLSLICQDLPFDKKAIQTFTQNKKETLSYLYIKTQEGECNVEDLGSYVPHALIHKAKSCFNDWARDLWSIMTAPDEEER
jgi:hypothetical protein